MTSFQEEGALAAPSPTEPEKYGVSLRSRAKELIGDLDAGYVEVGRILYKIWNSPQNGDQKQPPMYVAWGYKNFEDYVRAELNLDRRKAERLRRIAYTLEVELIGLSEEVRERLVKLGWTKMRELITVPLTLKNAEGWCDSSEQLSSLEVANMVKTHKEAVAREERRLAHLEQAGTIEVPFAQYPAALLGVKPNPDKPPFLPTPEGPSPESLLPKTMTKEQILNKMKDSVPEVAQKGNFKRFYLFEDQMEIVDAALDRASQVAHSSKTGHLLTSICLDYLATNDFLKGGAEQRMKFLAKNEELLGVRLIAVDPEDGEILYGISTLEKLAGEK